ncbi:3'-5' exonuclease [Pseudogulbenkiania subflava]|uniref:DNA-directed DNA polymerase n=1 Tax=Pseudogulbenkiania subflava DSM 22618 TaxID=1123014 RepID=A0A1Y6BX21_9NEIS|nr:exonuclease domain-containing protein [Pseudogulbenkiania subflava]SMF29597.1 DNA polymerase-3 subunit epsilon [Pseudogulbenkiania subflava DSM 22618]
MTPSRKLGLAAGTACLAIVAALAATAWLAWHAARGTGLALNDLVTALLILALLLCGSAVAALRDAVARYVRAPLRLAEEVATVVADASRRVNSDGGSELHGLAQAINELAAARAALQRDVAEQVRRAQHSLEAEKNRLAALMAELHQSVVVCNLDGRILLYNQRARAEVGDELLGLGRSIYAIFDHGLIAYALESVGQRLGRETVPAAEFVAATAAGRLLRVHLAPVLGGDAQEAATAAPAIAGFVLILDDITASFAEESRRDTVIQAFTEGVRGPLGSLRAAAEMLSDYGDMGEDERRRFLGVIRDEAQQLSQRLECAASDYGDALKARWPLEVVRGVDVVTAALQRVTAQTGVPCKAEDLDDTLWIKVDSFSLLQALSYLTGRLHDEYGVREVRLALSRAEHHAQLDLIWSGTAMNTETAMSWELDTMQGAGTSAPSVREVVERCNGEMWFERQRAAHRALFRLLLPLVEPRRERHEETRFLRGGSRPEFYDFDLFRWSEGGHALDERLLSELSYTVFDTETTGLEPAAGDEIIQIGATRIVNRRLLQHEGFEQLVDPRRPLPEDSVKIHGITPEMLAGQPHLDTVLPAFRAYCADTVLVAHNAAFDMRFLQLKEEATGVRFDQPVLDTLLLSAVLHPNQESHRLEAIAERLGVTIIGRHTAMGDAIVTGEVFLKMIPLLAEKGIRTLREAREASERTFYARVRY